MSEGNDKSIETGDVSGTGIAIGHGARATVTITQQNRDEIAGLLRQLRAEIQQATLPDSTKNVIANKALSEMESALESDDPKSGLARGLERINDQLEGVGAAASSVSGIVQTVAKIAGAAGIVVKTVAPFLAALL
jgi:hypothetical protein